MSKIFGVLGLANSGKSTVSEMLVNEYGFEHMSFADSLKEAISSIFGWPMEMLRGKTSESRIWREQIDEWWAKRLGMPELTPRWVLQQWGTEICRNRFHQDIWVASLEKKLNKTDKNIVIDDCRFVNEITAIKNSGGLLLKVMRGPLPPWHSAALTTLDYGDNLMAKYYPTVHISEWGWADQKVDFILDNNNDLNNLRLQIKKIMS
jgi:hypothetical protein